MITPKAFQGHGGSWAGALEIVLFPPTQLDHSANFFVPPQNHYGNLVVGLFGAQEVSEVVKVANLFAVELDQNVPSEQASTKTPSREP